MPKPRPTFSFIIPVMNEEGNVKELHQQLITAVADMTESKDDYELIFVDDGSTDDTVAKLRQLSPLRLIELRGNYGQTAALDAGIKAARGEFIITMDGDLQNDPADVPVMYQALLDRDKDVICGWRKDRKDPWSKKFISDGAKFLRSFLVSDGIHDSGCTLRVYRAACFEDLTLRGEMHRFIPAILKWRGFNIDEVPVNHRPRTAGKTKYNFKRTIKGLLDMMSLWFFRKFSTRPLHLMGAVGLLSAGAGVALGATLVLARLGWGYALSDKIWPLASVFLILFGVQMFVSGLLMDLVIQNSEEPGYWVKRSEQL
jgi:glycosyltransferase involved in cell wall biosynthesis